jgi:sugar-phosphatase
LIAAEDVQRGKPDPEGYLEAAKLLDAPIAECLVFEDSVAGIEAARAAGAHVVVIGAHAEAESGLAYINNYHDV